MTNCVDKWIERIGLPQYVVGPPNSNIRSSHCPSAATDALGHRNVPPTWMQYGQYTLIVDHILPEQSFYLDLKSK